MVPPLNGEWENPFIGQKIYGYDYILLVDNPHDYRIYGTEESITFIDGNVTMMGDLILGKEVILKNLIINGNLYIKIGNGTIRISNVNVQNVYYIQ